MILKSLRQSQGFPWTACFQRYAYTGFTLKSLDWQGIAEVKDVVPGFDEIAGIVHLGRTFRFDRVPKMILYSKINGLIKIGCGSRI